MTLISTVSVKNYKSIESLQLELGRVTVLIGTNGSGKSNILEAIALAAATAQDKLDNEFLISRGIRVTEEQFMRSAFGSEPKPRKAEKITDSGSDAGADRIRNENLSIQIDVILDNGQEFICEVTADNHASYPRWRRRSPFLLQQTFDKFKAIVNERNSELAQKLTPEVFELILIEIKKQSEEASASVLGRFLVYSPENSSLRTFQAEGQILPLGIKGEGLFAHLKGLDTSTYREKLDAIREKLRLIEWFDTFVIPDELSPGERTIKIQDRFLTKGTLFDQRSANEGFLFLLFYFTLFISPDTPAFFSIDNVDNSLNPKMCTLLMKSISKMAAEYGKQVILTTHNPAILDGLDLKDENQRLLVVDRDKGGRTRVRRVDPPRTEPDLLPVSLSEAFMRGYIGGLPKNF